MADGSIIIEAGVETGKAEKDLDMLEKSVKDTGQKIENDEIAVKVNADTEKADKKLENTDKKVKNIGNSKTSAEVDASTEGANTKIDAVKGSLDAVSQKKAKPAINVDPFGAETGIARVSGSLSDLSSRKTLVRINAETSGAEKGTSKLKDNFEQLKKKATDALKAIAKGADEGENSLNRASVGVGGLVAKFGAMVGFTSLVSKAIGRVDTIDTATKSLTVLTGSADTAKGVMDDLSEAIQGTPIALNDVALGAKKMVAAGMEGSKVKDVFTAIADAAYGVGNGTESIDQMTDAISSLQSSGVAYSDDINRLVDSGVPAWQMLANGMGMSVTEMKDYASKGLLDSNKAIELITEGIENGTDGIAGKTASMAGLAKTAGDTISGSFANTKTSVVKSLANIAENLKGPIIDALNWAQQQFKGFADYTASPEFQAGLTKFIEILKNVVSAVGKVIEFLKPFAPVIAGVVTAFLTFQSVMKVISGVKSAIGALSSAFTLLAANPVGLVIAAIAGVVAGLVYLWNTNEGFRNFITSAWEKISGTIKTVCDIIGNAFGGIVALIRGDTEGMKEHMLNVYNALPSGIQSALTTVGTVVQEGQNFIHSFLTGDTEGMKNSLIGIYNALPAPVQNAIQSMGTWLNNKFSSIRKFGEDTTQKMKQKMVDIYNALPSPVQNAMTTMSNINRNIQSGLRSFLTGDTQGMKKSIVNIYDALPAPVQSAMKLTSTLATNIQSGLRSFMTGDTEGMKQSVLNIWDALPSPIRDIATNIKDTAIQKFTELKDNVISRVGELPGKLYETMTNALGQMIQGIQDKFWEVVNNVGSLVQTVIDKFKEGFGINSPSKVLYDIGNYLIQGLVNGLNGDTLMAFVNNMIGKMKDAFSNGKFSILKIIEMLGDGATKLFEKMGIKLGNLSGALFGQGGMLFPSDTHTLTSYFGYRNDTGGVGSTYHQGIDIGAAYGEPIYAAMPGQVEIAGSYGGYGNAVKIDHGGGLETLYGHMSAVAVDPGAPVAQGQIIGFVGSTGNSTGPHLHFSVLVNGEQVDPLSFFPGFSVGSRYIPKDMLAVVHKGEGIVKSSENPYANSGGSFWTGMLKAAIGNEMAKLSVDARRRSETNIQNQYTDGSDIILQIAVESPVYLDGEEIAEREVRTFERKVSREQKNKSIAKGLKLQYE